MPDKPPAPVEIAALSDDVKADLAAAAATAIPPPPAAAAQTQGQQGSTGQQLPNVMTTGGGQLVAAPTTTEEEDRATVGQRRINLIWETTQALVALSVTITTLVVSARMAIADEPDSAAFLLLSNVFFLVVGTYFHRTNNTATGGVGKGYAGR